MSLASVTNQHIVVKKWPSFGNTCPITIAVHLDEVSSTIDDRRSTCLILSIQMQVLSHAVELNPWFCCVSPITLLYEPPRDNLVISSTTQSLV